MLGQKVRLVVEGRKRYKFADENTGEVRKGAKIAIGATPVKELDQEGVFQTELPLAQYEDYDIFAVIPGTYDVEMHMKAGKGGAKFIVQSATLVTK